MREQKFNSSIITVILLFSILSLSPIFGNIDLNEGEGVRENLYFDLMNNSFNLTEAEVDLLDQNEFIVLNRLGTDDVLDAFAYYWDMDLPVFITTDMILHVWHLIFDKTLASAEETVLAPLFLEWLEAMRGNLQSSLAGIEQEVAAQHSLIYLNVAIKLLNPDDKGVPTSINGSVETILNTIYIEPFIENAISLLNEAPVNRFVDDFSQYKPRGHYTQSDTLMRYFRAFKWLSRIPFFYDDYLGFGVLQTSPEDMIRSSIYLSHAMKYSEVTSSTLGIEANGFTIWRYLKIFIDLIVGQTYAVDPPTVFSTTSDVLQSQSWQLSQIEDHHIGLIKDKILEDPNVPEPNDPFIIDARLMECGNVMIQQDRTSCSPKTMVMFGERLGKDTFALNQYVSPLGTHKFPNGLQFVSSILKSDHAKSLLINSFPEYDQQEFDEIDAELATWPGNSEETLGSIWFNSLEELVKPQPDFNSETIPIVPNFMQSSKWLDQKLTTVLGSWAQFRHDTILYSKTSIDTPACNTPEGYVEPYPMFYNNLRQTASLFSSSISELADLGFDKNTWNITRERSDRVSTGDTTYFTLLENFTDTLEILENIAITELLGLELSNYERDFLRSTYKINKERGCALLENQVGWLPSILGMLTNGDPSPHLFDKSPNTQASLIADIFTSNKYKKTVEVGTGLLEHMIVELPGWNGTTILAIGPVFSYYEFVLPIEDRMTDEEWRGIIYQNANGIDKNLGSYRGFWADSYMVSTSATQSLIYRNRTNHDNHEPPDWDDEDNDDYIDENYSDTGSEMEDYSIIYTTGATTSSIIEINPEDSNNDNSILRIPIFILATLTGITWLNRRKRFQRQD